ncbi:MAG: hypothetical protein AAF799_04865 [Myxococcota bacterium]
MSGGARAWVGATIVALGLGIATGVGCGRSPVWLPCDGLETVENVPALSCDHPACASATSLYLDIGADNVLIVQDRSCSMAELIDGRNKWSRAVEALVGVLTDPRSTTVRWGLSLFPDGNNDGIQGPIIVPVAAGQSGTIAALLTNALDRNDRNHPQQPGEGCFTNLADALDQAADPRVFSGLDGSSHLLLITDGFARHGGEVASSLVSILQELHDEGTPTFVVGFGARVSTNTLNALARAGGVPASASTGYYDAGLEDLSGALLEVVQGLRCRHRIDLPPEDVSRLLVRWADDTFIPAAPNGGDGWRYDVELGALVFSGWACEQLLVGDVTGIELDLDCG